MSPQIRNLHWQISLRNTKLCNTEHFLFWQLNGKFVLVEITANMDELEVCSSEFDGCSTVAFDMGKNQVEWTSRAFVLFNEFVKNFILCFSGASATKFVFTKTTV